MIALGLHRFVPQQEKYTTIPVIPEIRDCIRQRKRGQETYSDILETMVELYDSEYGTSREATIDEARNRL